MLFALLHSAAHKNFRSIVLPLHLPQYTHTHRHQYIAEHRMNTQCSHARIRTRPHVYIYISKTEEREKKREKKGKQRAHITGSHQALLYLITLARTLSSSSSSFLDDKHLFRDFAELTADFNEDAQRRWRQHFSALGGSLPLYRGRSFARATPANFLCVFLRFAFIYSARRARAIYG